MTQPSPQPQLALPCPPEPAGCGAAANAPCRSHGGTRVRHRVHQARTAAWHAARIAAAPAAALVADAVAAQRIRHGKHAAVLLDEHGYTAEAEAVRTAVARGHGHLSAKQAVDLLLKPPV
jgi:hypothetical protein